MIPGFMRYRGAVLDGLSVPSVGAFSLRKLRTAYAGMAVNVRRSSDNTTQDIGFVGSALDTTSLLSFVGAGSGYVATWYDQSGNGRNATQATAANQPMIVNAGAIVTLNSVPTTKFYNGAISSLSATINAFSAGYALNAVVVNTGAQQYASIADKSAGGNGVPWSLFGTGGGWIRWYVGSNYLAPSGSTSSPAVITHQVLASSLAANFFYNGTSTLSGTATSYSDSTNPVTLGRRGDSQTWLDGNLSELLLFASPLSDTDRHILERNQGTFYGITVV